MHLTVFAVERDAIIILVRIDHLPYRPRVKTHTAGPVLAFPKMIKPIRGLFAPVWGFSMSRYLIGQVVYFERYQIIYVDTRVMYSTLWNLV